MNEIIKKLRIPGYKTKVIYKPIKNKENKRTDGIQLSLDIETERRSTDKTGEV